METGRLIKELRTEKGMTQEQLAELTELSTRTIQRIEGGDVDPRAYTLQMIAKALEVDFSIFVDKKLNEDKKVKVTTQTNWRALLYFSGILPLILPTFLIWNTKKEEIQDLSDHYKAILRMQLMVLFALIGTIWVFFQTNMTIPFFGLLIANALFTIMNVLRIISTTGK